MRFPVALGAAALVLALAGCSRPAPDPPAAPVHGAVMMRPDSLGRRRPIGLQVQAAVTDTGWLDHEPAEPTTAYGSFEAACGALEKLMRRALGACADSAQWTRGTTTFLYRDSVVLDHDIHGRPFYVVDPRAGEVSVPALVVRLTTSSPACPGDTDISKAISDAGWVENYYYSADGPDGTDFAYFCREALVYVEMQWDGGDDMDTTYVPKPGYVLALKCVPRPPESPEYRRARR